MQTADTKLHIGCFDQKVFGWVNTDITPHLFVARVPGLATVLFRLGLLPRRRYEQHKAQIFHGLKYLNAQKRFPFADGTIDCIYSSHVLEHLYREDAIHCLAEMYRVLRPGGVVRVVVPDLDSFVARYDALEPDRFVELMFESGSKRTKNQHHWMYNRVSLTKIMADIGFAEIREQRYREGRCPDLAHIEVRPDSLFIEASKATDV